MGCVMTFSKGVIVATVKDAIAEFVGAELGQVEFFNAEIDHVVNTAGEYAVLIKYRGKDLRIKCDFTCVPDDEKVRDKEGLTIPFAYPELYENVDGYADLCRRLKPNMTTFVGAKITAFLQEHNPVGANHGER